jgi:hypothetical protein
MDLLELYYSKIIKSLNYIVHDYWEEIGDPRTKNFFLMDSGPWKIIAIMSFYILFVTKIGPQLMKGRKPFQLREAMLAYNVIVVLINAYFFFYAFYLLNFGVELLNFKFPDRNDFSHTERLKARLAYFYVWTKGIFLKK